MAYRLVIDGKLAGLNDYINASRANRNYGNRLKREAEDIVIISIYQQLRGLRIEKPVFMKYRWYEPNEKRDRDNVSSMGRKVIQDALVETKVLKNDGWNDVVGFSDEFYIDRSNPRIEVTIIEVKS